MTNIVTKSTATPTILIAPSATPRAQDASLSPLAVSARVCRYADLSSSQTSDYHNHCELLQAIETELEQLRSQLAAHERKVRVLDSLGDAVITTDPTGNIDFLNPLAEVLLGWTLAQARHKPVEACLHIGTATERSNGTRHLFDAVRSTQRLHSDYEKGELLRRDGLPYGVDYVVTPIRGSDGEFTGASFVIRDATERRNRLETINWRAIHDPLTGIINRAEFENRLKHVQNRAHAEEHGTHTLLFIDIDHFKFINDSYGHAAGDITLKGLAELLRSRIRGADMLARFGGDEFTALLYRCGTQKAQLIAEALRLAVEKHEFRWNQIDLPVSISIGIAEFDPRTTNIATVMHNVDSACYAAKTSGRNRVHMYSNNIKSAGSDTEPFERLKEIQAALHGNRLEVEYAMICATGQAIQTRICQASAVVRDQHGIAFEPEELQSLAQRYQLNADLDRWLRKAVVDALRLGHPALNGIDLVFVPLTLQSLNDARTRTYLIDLLRENSLLTDRLGFELRGWDNSGAARYFAAALKQLGCTLMVESPGFGSHGIEMLKYLSADLLTIEGSLIRNVESGSTDFEAVLGLNRIAHSLGMRTVALQVTSLSQRQTLAGMGIDFVKDHPDVRDAGAATEARIGAADLG